MRRLQLLSLHCTSAAAFMVGDYDCYIGCQFTGAVALALLLTAIVCVVTCCSDDVDGDEDDWAPGPVGPFSRRDITSPPFPQEPIDIRKLSKVWWSVADATCAGRNRSANPIPAPILDPGAHQPPLRWPHPPPVSFLCSYFQ